MCFYCKCKTTRPSVTTHVVTFDDCIIIIKNVPCEECEECGEKYFSDEVMVRLEKIVEAEPPQSPTVTWSLTIV